MAARYHSVDSSRSRFDGTTGQFIALVFFNVWNQERREGGNGTIPDSNLGADDEGKELYIRASAILTRRVKLAGVANSSSRYQRSDHILQIQSNSLACDTASLDIVNEITSALANSSRQNPKDRDHRAD